MHRVLLILLVFLLGFGGAILSQNTLGKRSVSKGQQIYIQEGCIHCHTQFSRPVQLDQTNSGPPTNTRFTETSPILIGNRRQGPDLSNIGARRSREWNRLHLMDPQSLSPGSRMPPYKGIFTAENQSEGEALLDYLSSLVSEDSSAWHEQVFTWAPTPEEHGDLDRGQVLYTQFCSQCHNSNGDGKGILSQLFSRKPRDLVSKDFLFAPNSLPSEIRKQRIAQIIKYGQQGTSMPGHEYLTDREIVDLVVYIESLSESLN